MVSVQPASGPASLVYVRKKSKERILITHEAVASKCFSYDFGLFSTVDFETIKETYANEMALSLDVFIANKLQKTNIFHEIETEVYTKKIKYELIQEVHNLIRDNEIDYVITSQRVADAVFPHLNLEIDVYTLPGSIELFEDTEYPKTVSAIGKYPTSKFDSKHVFVPYLLCIPAPQTTSTVRTLLFRAGWYDVE